MKVLVVGNSNGSLSTPGLWQRRVESNLEYTSTSHISLFTKQKGGGGDGGLEV